MASWLVRPTPERAVRDRLSAVIDRVSIFWKKKSICAFRMFIKEQLFRSAIVIFQLLSRTPS